MRNRLAFQRQSTPSSHRQKSVIAKPKNTHTRAAIRSERFGEPSEHRASCGPTEIIAPSNDSTTRSSLDELGFPICLMTHGHGGSRACYCTAGPELGNVGKENTAACYGAS